MGFIYEENGVRFGLLAIKNLGKGLIAGMLREREENGKYKNFTDFCRRVYGREHNKRALESLIRSGALDSLAENRHQMLDG
jgi:DNA polymerase-3 subunit alpha